MSEITVMVPSYGHAAFVEAALRSIFAQTVAPKKLIVIDDGSNDESPAVIERTLADCPFRSEFISRENKGLCRTLNEGFALAEGDYFAYLGSDDLWLPHFLEEQSRLLDARPNAVLAFSHAYVIDENDLVIDTTDNWCDFPDGDLVPTLLAGDIFPSPGVLYRRSALSDLGWNPNAVLEDYELYLKLSVRGEFARNRERLCAWRIHGRNTSGQFPLMLREHIAAQDRVMDVLGLTRKELDELQTRLRFKGVADCIRHGHRSEAMSLFAANLRGARSLGHLAGTALRLSVPDALFRWNRDRKTRNTVQRYGKLDLTDADGSR